jgi:serine/threonine protein kinase
VAYSVSSFFRLLSAGKMCRIVNVAVKTLKKGTMTSDEFLSEAKRMHQLRHPKLLLLMGVCTLMEPYYIITEMMANGSLLNYLKQDSIQTTITLNTLIDMAAQVNINFKLVKFLLHNVYSELSIGPLVIRRKKAIRPIL